MNREMNQSERTISFAWATRFAIAASLASMMVGLTACDVSGQVASRWSTSAELGSAGGTLQVTSNDDGIAGASLSLAPGALSASTELGIAPAESLATGDWLSAGPAVAFGPADLALTGQVLLTIPAAAPSGYDANDLLLLFSGDEGSVVLDGTHFQFDGSALHTSAPALGTLQAVVGKSCTHHDTCQPGNDCVHGNCRPGLR